MDPAAITLGILLAGIVVVIGGVLFFRLHAFLALTLGALVVAACTPRSNVETYSLKKNALMEFRENNLPMDGVSVETEKIRNHSPATVYLLLRQNENTNRFFPIGEFRRAAADEGKDSQDTSRTRLTEVSGKTPSPLPMAGDILIHPADWENAQSLARKTFASRVTEGFGQTCTKIGILIALASIIGMCLLESGAADRVVRSTLKKLGEKGAPASFLSSGFLLGVPVFFDTVFYLMIPLGKAMRLRVGKNYLLYVLTIVAGATMAHSLVPPTPGPLFVAEQLNVEIGVMILAGGIVGLFTAGFGYLYAGLANRIWDLPLRESPDCSLADLEKITRKDESELPGFFISILPVILPVVLIGGNTVLKQFSEFIANDILRIAAILGDKNIALGISAAVALYTLVKQKRSNLKALGDSVQSALSGGGVIILITAAGGAFGAVLQQTGVSGLISGLPQASGVVVVGLAFLITATIRTAQGSATVAMITAVGILSGLKLDFHPVYLALAIGCGSKPIGWMNDSGFWVITKMSGMTEAEGLKYVTPMTSLMGVVGLIVTMIGVSLWPNLNFF
ncbi:MAG: SLC13 family permease [Planctomycetaceae bacterium]